MEQAASESTITAPPLSLWDMAEGQIGEISSYSSELADAFCSRLQEIGFLPGGEVSCLLATDLGAPRLYSVHNAVFSLDNSIAQHVQITLRSE